MTARDPVVLALTSIAAGAASAAAVITLGMVVLRGTALAQTEGSGPFLILTITTLIGIVVAISTPWYLTRTIDDLWRRGVTCAVATMLGLILSAVTAPVDMAAGLTGLIVLLAVFAIAAAMAFRGAFRAAR